MDTAGPLFRAYRDGVGAFVRGELARARPRRPGAQEITELAHAFVRDIAKMSVVIPGQHYSGLSNQALLEVRVREGRDYDADTAQLRQYLRRELARRFRGWARLPTLAELSDLASDLTINWIANERVLGEGGDIEVPPLTPAYAAAKRKAGYGGKPVGVRRGRWLAALRRGHVEFT